VEGKEGMYVWKVGKTPEEKRVTETEGGRWTGSSAGTRMGGDELYRRPTEEDWRRRQQQSGWGWAKFGWLGQM